MRGVFARSKRFPARPRPLRARLGIAGMTYLELCMVIQIIGFLATIVMQNYYRSKKAAEVAVVVQNIRNVQTALASYYVMESTYPPTLNSIWLDFYHGRVIGDYDYCTNGVGGGGWNFFVSNDPDIRFNGPARIDQYAIKSTEAMLPYARYIYGDVATQAKIIH